MNLAGALGPALGGLVIASTGAGWVFIVNAVSFLAVIVAVFRWKRNVPDTTLPAEHVAAAVRTGARYVSNQVGLLLLLVRVSAIAIPATALAALLPLVARNEIGVSAGEYGLIGAFSTVFSVIQSVLPGWVRGRGLATAMLVFQGTSMAAALGWGAVASGVGSGTAVVSAGIAAVVLGVVTLPIRLASRAELDLTPMPLGALRHVIPIDPEEGPVLVSLQWHIDAERRNEFIAAMRPIRRLRRRDGAMQWGLFEVVEEPGTFVEQFTVSTWSEHERQHERPTAADAEITAAAEQFLVPGASLQASHRIAAHLKRRGRAASHSQSPASGH